MQDEPDTSADEVETDNVRHSDTDTPDDVYDFYDPDEGQDNEDVVDEEGTDDEADEAETDDTDESQEAEDDEGQNDTLSDDIEVAIPGGETVSLGELKDGFLRQSDYTRKAQEVANMRRSAADSAQRIESVTEALVDHLAQFIPAEPPVALSQTDPLAYTRQKAAYDSAVAQLEKVLHAGAQAKSVSQGMTETDYRRLVEKENEALASVFPETRKPDGRKQFFDDVLASAMKLGFSADELGQVVDHRVLALAKWAKRGMDADMAAAKAKTKAEKAPPVAPRKPGQGARRPNQNAKAMRKARQTGDINDVLAVDFDF